MTKGQMGLRRNVGLIGILGLTAVAVLLVRNSVHSRLMAESIVMACGCVCVAILMTNKQIVAGRLLAIGLSIGYVAQRLVMLMINPLPFDLRFFAWFVIPVGCFLFAELFLTETNRLIRELDIERERQEDLVMLSEVTGLYNQRALLTDLRMQQAYCERNGMLLSLMLLDVKLFDKEGRPVEAGKGREMYAKIAETLVDALRIEDRVYDLNNNGLFGILLNCESNSFAVVSERMRYAVTADELYEKAVGGAVNPKINIACSSFKKEEYHADAEFFLRKMMNEMQ